MKALILAAGQGDRLETLTDNLPKALVRVAKRELLRYQLDFLADSAIKTIGIVGGHHLERLVHFLKHNQLNINLFENKKFQYGSVLSLKAALPFLDDDFLLMNADHIYPKKLLRVVLKQVKGITAACDFDRPLVDDDMKVKLNGQKNLKEIHKQLKSYDGGYIGLTYCPKEKLVHYKSALEMVLKNFGPKANVEMILGELAKSGESIHIADTSGTRWLEVDTLEDLKKAEKALENQSI